MAGQRAELGRELRHGGAVSQCHSDDEVGRVDPLGRYRDRFNALGRASAHQPACRPERNKTEKGGRDQDGDPSLEG